MSHRSSAGPEELFSQRRTKANTNNRPESLSEVYPAVADVVPGARRSVVGYAERAGLDANRVQGLRLAVSEAITNVIRHAYPEKPGPLYVNANVAADELWVLVCDRGCGHQTPSPDPGMGFGLGIIAHECDDVVIAERAEGGTELRMQFLLPQPRGSSSAAI